VIFGDAAPPAPPASAIDYYGPSHTLAGSQPYPSPYDGFAYTARDLAFDGSTLSLRVAPGELLASWCAVQTSYDWRACPDCPDAAPGILPVCSCLPNWAGMQVNGASDLCEDTDPKTGQNRPIRCSQVGPCETYFNVCNCSAGGCVADLTHAVWTLSLTLSGGGAFDGTVSIGAPEQVHLTAGP
jgi:hypothetical protein